MAGKGPQSRAQGGIKAKFEETGQKKFPAKDTAIHHELIKIKVTDEYHLPVTSATVRFLSDRKRFAVTDVNGMIVLNKVAAAETLILSGVGYKEKATTIKDIDSGVIVLQRDLKVLNEVVVVSGNSHTRGLLTSAVTRSITLRDTIRNLLVSAVKVYPNPVLRGSAVNVSLKLKKAGTFHLYVMDAAGKLTLSQNYVAADKKSLQQVMIPPAWSKGIYFIIIVNEEGRTIAKEKMVVM